MQVVDILILLVGVDPKIHNYDGDHEDIELAFLHGRYKLQPKHSLQKLAEPRSIISAFCYHNY